ncbi:hypothetical protein HDK64DRAFT_315026 [Phyllosticta capitalensis]
MSTDHGMKLKKFRSTKSLKKAKGQNAAESDRSLSRASSSSSTLLEFSIGRNSRSQDRSSDHAKHNLSSSPSPHPKKTQQPSPLGIDEASLGLQVVYQPQTPAPLDIVFVHGLGGHSRKTWSKHHDVTRFWPGIWLPDDPEVGKARILTFGYNANFSSAQKGMTNITNFAKELLNEMRRGRSEKGELLELGRVPIIFVVHSMGGLVVKKAYLLGQNDEEYREIVHSISGIVFLSTPHRGTDLAEILNRILMVSFRTPKGYVQDLARNSTAIEEVNEQFRHIAPKLLITSFYETLATAIGPTNIMILEGDSSVMGYPQEVSIPLLADHHSVCKYSSPQERNYVKVLNTLKDLIGRLQVAKTKRTGSHALDEIKTIQKLLSVTSNPDLDLEAFRKTRTPGTCEWLFDEPEIISWMDPTPGCQVVWLSAQPACGKSILCTYLIDQLRQSRKLCQYFFFRFNHQEKRSLSDLLRSLALQIARDVPNFKRTLVELSSEGFRLGKADASLIWRKVFEERLFRMDLDYPLYWVIDALDESDSPRALLDLLRSLSNIDSEMSIRICIVSRKVEALTLAFDRLAKSVPLSRVEKAGSDHNYDDIRLLVDQELSYMRGSSDLREKIKQKIMSRAEGNFLWARLVVEDIQRCHTEEAIHEALDEIPGELSRLYQRMEATLLDGLRKSDRCLARALLQWTICSRRPLHLSELSQALRPGLPEFLDLQSSISDLCGQFVQVDPTGHVGLVHQTAREYFTQITTSELSVNPKEAHGQLFTKSIHTLADPALRLKLTQTRDTFMDKEPFLCYAAVSWAHHLQRSDKRDEYLDMLVKLFEGPSVLWWIHTLYLIDKAEILIKTSKILSSFVSATRKLYATKNPMLHRLSDLELLDQWTIDLIKIMGKFSGPLQADPRAVYKLVPPFCPEKSLIHRQFYDPASAELTVSGIANDDWDDNLARINLSRTASAKRIVCAGDYIAVLRSDGTFHLFDSQKFSEIATISHGEPVTAMALNKKGTKMVTYGLTRAKLWSLPDMICQSVCPTPPGSLSMELVFADKDSKIITASRDRTVRWLQVEAFESGWQILHPDLLKDSDLGEGAILNSPKHMAFNGDATQIAVSYRSFPLSVWSLSDANCVNRCTTTVKNRHNESKPATWFPVDRFAWNPVTGHIIGLYKDGRIFKWHPLTDESQEVRSSAGEIAASSNGKLFATSNSNGTVTIWDFAYFSVIYQLASDDLVTGLTFSPDCTRFYDLRSNTVNAWESNSLLRFSEAEEGVSDTASEQQSSTCISKVSEAYQEQFDAISTLAVAPRGEYYCAGDENGTVTLYGAQSGESVELSELSSGDGEAHLKWSDDCQHIAAYLDGRITILRIELESGKQGLNKAGRAVVASHAIEDLTWRGMHELLLSPDSKSLLIVSENNCHILFVDDGSVRASTTVERGTSRKWLNHPSRHDLLLSMGPQDVRVFRWDDLAEDNRLQIHEAPPQNQGNADLESQARHDPKMAPLPSFPADEDGEKVAVVKALLTPDGKHVLVQVNIGPIYGALDRRVLLFDSSSFDPQSQAYATGSLPYLSVPQSLSRNLEACLGVLSGLGSRLVFLDQELWICTYDLLSGSDDGVEYENALQRHFFVPRDWMSGRGLELCALMEDGALLCPKNDRVAVIRGGLR